MNESRTVASAICSASSWGQPAIRIAVAGVLLIAVAMKANAMIAGTATGQFAALPAVWRFLVVEYELLLACLLLFVGMGGVIWWATVATFSLFALINVWAIMSGQLHCGCFGIIRLSPGWTLLLDAAIVGLMICSRVGRIKSRSPQQTPASASPGRSTQTTFEKAVIIFGVVAGFGAGLWALSADSNALSRSVFRINPTNIGNIPQADDYSVELTLINQSDSPQVISGFRATCGIGAIDAPGRRLRLLPHGEQAITIHLRAYDLAFVTPDFLGRRRWRGTIHPLAVVSDAPSNDTVAPHDTGPLAIEGTWTYCLSVTPTFIAFAGHNAVDSSAPPTPVKLNIVTHPLVERLEVLAHQSAPFTWTLKQLADDAYELVIMPADGLAPGEYQFAVRLRAYDKAQKLVADVSVPGLIQVLSRFHVEPPLLSIVVPLGGERAAEVSVAGRHGQRFEVLRASVPNDALHIAGIAKSEDNTSSTIVLQCRGTRLGRFETRLCAVLGDERGKDERIEVPVRVVCVEPGAAALTLDEDAEE